MSSSSNYSQDHTFWQQRLRQEFRHMGRSLADEPYRPVYFYPDEKSLEKNRPY
jgi:hypothetical protein